MSTNSETPQESSPAPPLEVSVSRGLIGWMADHRICLAFTTYQAGKLMFIGRRPDGLPMIHDRSFNRCLGLWASPDGQTLWMSSLYQVWRLENSLRPGERFQRFDRMFVPRMSWTTGQIDIHDLAVDGSGRLIFVNTAFNCLATLSSTCSFTPLWMPPFISRLVPEDRCHLNGLAISEGRPRFVTVVSTSDVLEGWRDRRRNGGCVIELSTGRTVCEGLSMPHSPRVYRDRLWLHNSGEGYFGSVGLDGGPFEPLTFCPGYLRGLCFVDDYAVMGISRPRSDEKTFNGLALQDNLRDRGGEPRCGLLVVRLSDGAIVEWVGIEGVVRELYDVVAIAETTSPMALGFKTDEIERHLVVDDFESL